MVDKYNNFAELALHEEKDIDYRILQHSINSKYAIIAPHGGRIEHGTSQLALAIADRDYAYYCFEGLKPKSHDLHITSNRFDEPQALVITQKVNIVITLHGAYGKEPHVFLGGLHEILKEAIIHELLQSGFDASHDPSPTRQGKGKTNICNRGKLNQGVQIEMTQGLRKSLFDKPDYNHTKWRPNEKFTLFVEAIRRVLSYDS